MSGEVAAVEIVAGRRNCMEGGCLRRGWCHYGEGGWVAVTIMEVMRTIVVVVMLPPWSFAS